MIAGQLPFAGLGSWVMYSLWFRVMLIYCGGSAALDGLVNRVSGGQDPVVLKLRVCQRGVKSTVREGWRAMHGSGI